MNHNHRQIERVPGATYRIQMTPQFGFAAAKEIVPYLSKLGITDLYSSPILTARPGSKHGYDIVDPLHLNPELGGQEEFDELVQALHEHGMGLLLDIVPNHMAASGENPWWLDVLENGPSSRFADFFDIEWDPGGFGALENRVLLPVLGSPYGETLENGEIQLEADDTGYHLRYYEMELPLSTISYGYILRLRAVEIEQSLGSGSGEWASYSRLLDDIAQVPSYSASDPKLIERHQNVRRRLEYELPRLRRVPAIGRQLEEAISTLNGTPGDPRTFDTLDQIIASQAYRLSFWQLAREQINYRRFFDINDLISMHVEEERVFRAMHERVLRLVHSRDVTGLRIDHIDGLWDPEGYLMRLQRSLAEPPGKEDDAGRYVVVEKILSREEGLSERWPVAGTTGYDFMNALNGLMIDHDGVRRLGSIYQRISGMTTSFTDLVYQAKIRVLDESFAANVQALSVMLGQIADQDRHGRDLTFESMKQALIEITAAMPVYRTYINGLKVDESDQRWIETAIDKAMIRRPDLRHTLAFVRRVLLLQIPPYIEEADRADWLSFVMRWQQLTGPAMAKGEEDTALYQYNRLLSLNEVGGHPDSSGLSINEWHVYNAGMYQDWPHTLNATSTHDTKRSEDVRARIAVLSEMPDEWSQHVATWQELNAGKRPVRNGVPIPDANVEIQIYQTMLGGWPNDPVNVAQFLARLKAYLTKAAREAKTYTSWIDVDTVYENALLTFVESIFDQADSAEFLADFCEFHRVVSRAGAINSLSQTLLRLTAPGVPDTYQGTELWDYSLVDPDNRRPVDYDVRRRAVDEVALTDKNDDRLLAELVADWQDGRIKLFLTQRALQLRNQVADLFADGDYAPCMAEGPLRDHVICFARRHLNQIAVVVAPRLVLDFVRHQSDLSLANRWKETYIRLPNDVHGPLVDHIGNGDVQVLKTAGGVKLTVDDVLSKFPCGLLRGEFQVR